MFMLILVFAKTIICLIYAKAIIIAFKLLFNIGLTFIIFLFKKE